MKKLLAFILTVGVIISVYAPTAQALLIGTEEVDLTQSSFSSTIYEDINNMANEYVGLIEYLHNQIKEGNTTIYLYDWNIPYTKTTTTDLFGYLLCYYLSDVQYYNRYGLSFLNQKVYQITIETDFTKSQIIQMVKSIDDAVNKMVMGLNGLTDTEKALIIHDRLIQKCSYDQNPLSNGKYTTFSYTTYGALVLHTAVCGGYAAAYKTLLNKANIPAYVCVSNTMNHAWNIITINDKKYHVDCTWDDYDMYYEYGYVMHRNFLRSTEGIKSTGHQADDFDSTPTDTAYDSGQFWSNLIYGIQCINGTLYYPKSIYKEGSYLMTISNFQFSEKACSIDGNYCKLNSDGKYYYYNTIDSIIKLDVDTGTKTTLYTNTGNVAGFKLIDNKLIIDIGIINEYYTPEYRKTHTVTINLPLQYTITFDTTTITKELSSNEMFGELPVLQKDGYNFIGWFTDDDEQVTPLTIFTANTDITLYPKWKKIVQIKPDADATLDTDNNLLILTSVCDIRTLFNTDDVEINEDAATGVTFTVNSELFTVVIRGDTNQDGKTDARDIVYINCLMNDLILSTPLMHTACDVNADGQTDGQDVQQLVSEGLLY